jgi:hypothetical protein
LLLIQFCKGVISAGVGAGQDDGGIGDCWSCIRCKAAWASVIVLLMRSDRVRSAYVTNDRGAPLVGVAPWQLAQYLTKSVCTSQGNPALAPPPAPPEAAWPDPRPPTPPNPLVDGVRSTRLSLSHPYRSNDVTTANAIDDALIFTAFRRTAGKFILTARLLVPPARRKQATLANYLFTARRVAGQHDFAFDLFW